MTAAVDDDDDDDTVDEEAEAVEDGEPDELNLSRLFSLLLCVLLCDALPKSERISR